MIDLSILPLCKVVNIQSLQFCLPISCLLINKLFFLYVYISSHLNMHVHVETFLIIFLIKKKIIIEISKIVKDNKIF